MAFFLIAAKVSFEARTLNFPYLFLSHELLWPAGPFVIISFQLQRSLSGVWEHHHLIINNYQTCLLRRPFHIVKYRFLRNFQKYNHLWLFIKLKFKIILFEKCWGWRNRKKETLKMHFYAFYDLSVFCTFKSKLIFFTFKAQNIPFQFLLLCSFKSHLEMTRVEL